MTARLARSVRRAPVYLVLLVAASVWLTPTIGLLIASLRSTSANNTSGWWTALTDFDQLTFENYRRLFENARITDSLWNTILIAVPTTIAVVFLAALAGYAFAWVGFRGREALFLTVIALLVMPLQVALIPVADLYGRLGIYGTLSGVVLFHVAFGLPFAIFLLRNFFTGIPRELMEAARMDGASELRLFFRVVLPLAWPAVASLAIFQFLWTWNDLLVGLVFASPENFPITVAIQEQTRQFGSNIDVIAPGAFVSLIIPLIVFFAFQRYFVQGLLAGSGK